MKQEQQELRQRGLDSQLEVDHLNELAGLRKEILESKGQTDEVKSECAKATRENLESAKYLGSAMLRAIIDVTNGAFQHTNNVPRRQGAAQPEFAMLPHSDIEPELTIKEQHREINRRLSRH